MITFTVFGDVVAKERPRFWKGHVYTPKKTLDYEEKIRLVFEGKYPKFEAIEDFMEVNIIAYIKPPIKKNSYFPRKKDIDNIAKIALDGMNSIVYLDDKFVQKLTIEKVYDAIPRLEIKVKRVCEK